MYKGFKGRIAFEVLMILVALLILCFITRLWPLVFLVIPGILIAALRLLFISAKKKPDAPAAVARPYAPPQPDTEQDVIRIAFGILQRRISENIITRYPSARWVWEAPNAMGRFADGLTLVILLNRAGGYIKAKVQVCNLQYCGLIFETADTGSRDMPPLDIDMDGDHGFGYPPETDEAVDYALIAYQWVEANLLALNNRCNDAISEGRTTIQIPAADLPHPDSWADVCGELTRSGFTGAAALEDGISVSIPE